MHLVDEHTHTHRDTAQCFKMPHTNFLNVKHPPYIVNETHTSLKHASESIIEDDIHTEPLLSFACNDRRACRVWSSRLKALRLLPLSVFLLSGCLCGLRSQISDPYGKMTSEDIYHLPLNMYVIILGIGLFVFMLSLIFCCYMFRWGLLHGSDHLHSWGKKGSKKVLRLSPDEKPFCSR